MTTTNAERQKKWRDELKGKGLKQLLVTIPEKRVPELREIVKDWRDEHEKSKKPA